MSRKLVVTLVPVAAALIAGVGFYHVSSPGYSFAQIGKAMGAHDVTRFELYVDLDALAGDLADELVGGIMQEAGSSGSGINAASAAMLEKMKPGVVTELRAAIQQLARGEGTTTASGDAGAEVVQGTIAELGLDNISVEGTGEIVQVGERAVVPLQLHYADLDTTLALGVEMQRNGRRWRVVGLQDAFGFVKQLSDVTDMRLDSANEPIRAELAGAVALEGPQSRIVGGGWWFEPNRLSISVGARNLGERTITAVGLEILGGDGGRITMQGETVIQAGQFLSLVRTLTHDSDDDLQRALASNQLEGVQVRPLFVVRAGDAGPDTLAVFDSWDAVLAHRARSGK